MWQLCATYLGNRHKNVPPADVQFIDVGGDGAADFVRT